MVLLTKYFYREGYITFIVAEWCKWKLELTFQV